MEVIMEPATSHSSSGSARLSFSPAPPTVNPLASGSTPVPTGTQYLPPLLSQMARQFNIPEAIFDVARRGPEANLVLSTLALSFQGVQAELERLRTENVGLRGAQCPLNLKGHAPASDECTEAFVHAAERGDRHVMELLLSHAAVDVNVENNDSDQRTALHFAAKNNHETMVRKLLQLPEIESDHKDYHGSTPLLLAAQYGHVEVVRLLLENGNVDVNAQDAHGDTPLICAAKRARLDVIQSLLEYPAEAINLNLPDETGRTPLSWAADACVSRRSDLNHVRKGGAEAYAVVHQLLQKDGIDVNRPDVWGETPLTYAQASGPDFSNVCQLLRASGAR